MATTAPPTPAAPSTAPSSAPSTPSTSSTPSTPVTSTPVTSAPVAATPTTTAPEATAPATASKPQPRQQEYPGDPQAFLDALHSWEKEDGNEVKIPGQEDAAPEIKPEVKEAETPEVKAETEEAKDETEDKPWAPEPDNFTPEVVNEWGKKYPELEAAWASHPELKRQMHAMGRINAKAAPMLKIFPNVQSAEFAAQTSNNFVDLRGVFTAAGEDPSTIGGAYTKLAEQFMVRDKDGKPVMQDGAPQFFEEFEHLNNFVVDQWLDQDIAALDARIKAGQGTDDDEIALQNAQYLKERKKASGKPEGPDLSKLPPELRKYMEDRDKEINTEREKLGLQKKEQTATEKKATRDASNGRVGLAIGKSVGKKLTGYLKEKSENGIFIPSYVTSQKDPTTGISVFAKNVLDQFNAKCDSVAYVKDHIAQLRSLPPTPEAEKQRTDYGNQLVDEFLFDIIDSEVRKVQTGHVDDQKRRREQQKERGRLASAEPSGGASPFVQGTGQDSYSRAVEWVDKNKPDLDRKDRTVAILQKRNELERTR